MSFSHSQMWRNSANVIHTSKWVEVQLLVANQTQKMPWILWIHRNVVLNMQIIAKIIAHNRSWKCATGSKCGLLATTGLWLHGNAHPATRLPCEDLRGYAHSSQPSVPGVPQEKHGACDGCLRSRQTNHRTLWIGVLEVSTDHELQGLTWCWCGVGNVLEVQLAGWTTFVVNSRGIKIH